MKTALVFASDDTFIPYTAVVARRVALGSSEDFPIVVVSDGITNENKKLAQQFCPRIGFVEASHVFAESGFHTTDAYRRAAYLRLYLEEIMDGFDRTVYLDGDLSPLVDVSPLLRIKPAVSPIVATYGMTQILRPVHDVLPMSPGAGYLQSGVMVIDLKAVRQEGIFRNAIQFANDFPEKCALVDQDALNAVLNGRWQVLDWRWNVCNDEALYAPRPHFIRHHAGPHKPWSTTKTNCEPFIIKKWRQDLSETPWPDHFLPAETAAFFRRYLRPITRSIEVPLKALFRGGIDAREREIQRYRNSLPSLLQRIDANVGQLGSALTY